jgi:peptidoglycan/xylan/chitin deacetylase (PgdA/CDA1 family)
MSGSKSAILTYHSIDNSGSVISVAPELFRRHVYALIASGVPVVPLSEIRARTGSLALTFDDGFRNFAEHALPVLERYHLPATVFVVSGYCGGCNDWSQPRGIQIPTLPLMDWAQLQEVVRRGVTLGAHTVTHPVLTGLPDSQILRELQDCRSEVEDRTGTPVESFAYPYGASDHRVRALARRDFTIACGASLRFVNGRSEPSDLPRLDAYYLKEPWLVRNLLGRTAGAYLAARRFLRELRRGA